MNGREKAVRIIAGEAGGRTLLAPKGMDTRPTLDRVRESLFSILQFHLRDARVLDLFAGSGALGLEALSRGAAYAVFVDRARAAQEAVRRNIDTAGMPQRARLICHDWKAALAMLEKEAQRFDLVFLDPPYQMPASDTMLAVLRDSALLAPGGLAVYEHAAEHLPNHAGWVQADIRHYGDTAISFLSLPKEETP